MRIMNPRIGIKDIDFYERNWNDEKELHPEITGNKTFYVIITTRKPESNYTLLGAKPYGRRHSHICVMVVVTKKSYGESLRLFFEFTVNSKRCDHYPKKW